jgi:DNA-binding transcriptional MerR regulator
MDKGIGITQAAERTGLTPDRIRYFDQQFGQYLAIPRGPDERRQFDRAALERLATVVRLLDKEGLTVKQAKNYLGSPGQPSPAAPPDVGLDSITEKIQSISQDIERLRDDMSDLQAVVSRLVSTVAGLIEADSGRRA